MARGRPRKQGKRERNGRIERSVIYDKGSDRIQAMRDRYGEHYSSALGRLYATGFLGEGEQAKDRLDAGKRFARLYTRIIDTRPYRCALNTAPRGNVSDFADNERDQSDQAWLFNAMADLDTKLLRPWLDQLISKEFTDAGPVWATRLLMGGKDPYDKTMLGNALKALDVIAPRRKALGILVA